LNVKFADSPAAITTIIVSPIAREAANNTPLTIPGSAAGIITCLIVSAVTTVTVQMVALLTGDQEFDSTKTLAAFALGLGLFLTTLVLNIISLYVVRKYREQYD
jgi:phosphate transport system permease protein